jgi:glycosyltransferase involved in cell wall biosynthesis
MVDKSESRIDGSKHRFSLSIVTATFNSEKNLPVLVESLRRQTDSDFEWVIADGGSTDGTLSILGKIDDLAIVLSSEPDFGIYDALNRAISLASGEY